MSKVFIKIYLNYCTLIISFNCVTVFIISLLKSVPSKSFNFCTGFSWPLVWAYTCLLLYVLVCKDLGDLHQGYEIFDNI